VTDMVMGVHGNGITLTIQSPHGPLYVQELPMAALLAKVSGGEILRFTYDVTDPEEGTVTRGAARLVIEEIPDPRPFIAEETGRQPLGAGASVPHVVPCTPNCDGSDMCTGDNL